jgi:hypothetical protein
MSDIMKVAQKQREFLRTVNIHFVEVSPALRKIQAQSLGAEYPEEPETKQSAESVAEQPAEKKPKILLNEFDEAEYLKRSTEAMKNPNPVRFHFVCVVLCAVFSPRAPDADRLVIRPRSTKNCVMSM